MNTKRWAISVAAAITAVLFAVTADHALAGTDTKYNWASSPSGCYVENYTKASNQYEESVSWTYSNCYNGLHVEAYYWNQSWYGPYVASNPYGTYMARAASWWNYAGATEGWHTATSSFATPIQASNHTYAVN